MLDPARIEQVLRRGDPAYNAAVAQWKQLDEQRRKLQGELDAKRAERNAANETMAKLDKKSPDFASARDRLKQLSADIKQGEAQLADLETEATDRLLHVANAPHASVPDGAGDDANPVLHHWGEKPSFAFAPRPHWEVGEALGILDFAAGARISGARFTVLRGWAAKLTRALMNYMIELHTSHGYEEVWPPAMVRRAALRGTGQLPKFAADVFKIERPVDDAVDHVPDNDLFLSPTAEVQITNLHMDTIFEPG